MAGQGILEISQSLDRLGAGRNLPNVHFSLVREFFVLHRIVGRTWRGVSGYLEPCNFPSTIVITETISSTMK